MSHHGLSAEYLRSVPIDVFNMYIRFYNKEKIAEDEMLRERENNNNKASNKEATLLNNQSTE